MHDICTAPTMFCRFHPLNVLQINVAVEATCVAPAGSNADTKEAPASTLIPIPLVSGDAGAVRPTALLEIVTPVLKLTEIPMSVPAPVIVLLSIVTLAALNSRIAVDALVSDAEAGADDGVAGERAPSAADAVLDAVGRDQTRRVLVGRTDRAVRTR